MSLALLLASALLPGCGGEETEARRLSSALSGGTPAGEAVRLCESLPGDLGEECLASIAGFREDLPRDVCDGLQSDRWRGECHFATAERLAGAGERWEALVRCGLAGVYADECLYHVWTRELQAVVLQTMDMVPQDPAAPDPLFALEAAREVVEFYGQVETAGPAQEDRVWGDFWYFWWTNNRPARLDVCDHLDPRDRATCEAGTPGYVTRAVFELLRQDVTGSLRDRSCRGGAVPSNVLSPIARPHPVLLDAAEAGRVLVCDGGPGVKRPWNPVFQPRVRR